MSMKTERMLEVERQYERPLEELLPEVLNAEGSIDRAAERLGVSAHAIKIWVLRLGIRYTGTWSKNEGGTP